MNWSDACYFGFQGPWQDSKPVRIKILTLKLSCRSVYFILYVRVEFCDSVGPGFELLQAIVDLTNHIKCHGIWYILYCLSY